MGSNSYAGKRDRSMAQKAYDQEGEDRGEGETRRSTLTFALSRQRERGDPPFSWLAGVPRGHEDYQEEKGSSEKRRITGRK